MKRVQGGGIGVYKGQKCWNLGMSKKLTRVWQERRTEKEGTGSDWQINDHMAAVLTVLSLPLS